MKKRTAYQPDLIESLRDAGEAEEIRMRPWRKMILNCSYWH